MGFFKFILTSFSVVAPLLACNTSDANLESHATKYFNDPRDTIALVDSWKTALEGSDILGDTTGIVGGDYDDSNWEQIKIPHNWDQYYGYRRNKHGNLHGTAWYRTEFSIPLQGTSKHYSLFFEGVGSYATVWVNGRKIGHHQGGRTTFTLDITQYVEFNHPNSIVVKAEHPPFIADLPWVCGGCSGEWGFSEGSQPLGIFRPVSLIVSNPIKIEPFGVHLWNHNDISEDSAKLYVETELKNYGQSSADIEIYSTLKDSLGHSVVTAKTAQRLASNSSSIKVKQELPIIKNPELWSPERPYLYTLETVIKKDGKVVDKVETPYGIRWISYGIHRNDGDPRFYLNGKPYFINGTCEYEHLMGRSHSFTHEMIGARVDQIISGGFNAFREAHQPHNLQYQKHWDKEGILFWSQFSAHIWYDTPEFKKNFKRLLRQWIKERRNSPSVLMWGLQNESTIPKAFAQEALEIIKEMDPTASSQRLVTTCNGGEGTDWNVIQNWSGTYGGDPYNYAAELKKDLLNGEYGAWRTADLHTEGDFDQDGVYSEDRFAQLMEIKVQEAEKVKESVVGQYQWLFNSHENPGRIQNGEGYRDIDRVGPVNYKGLFTIWGEPLDAYYMYRGNYASADTDPMVYIASHSWPFRWKDTGVKDGIVVYSNCDQVELFNDLDGSSLGIKDHPGVGNHFQWDNVAIKYNVLKAVGYKDGKKVASDVIVLKSLPKSPNFDQFYATSKEVLTPDQNATYIYRVNAGGPTFTDSFGNVWSSDVHKTDKNKWGSTSWSDNFEDVPSFYASQRRTWDPIRDTKNWELFQSFRYGTDQLAFEFPVEDGDYQVELYFIEPWYGTGGGLDCTNWRNFDVAINDEIVLENLDIWKEVGHDVALKKTVDVKVENGMIRVHFPEVISSQAVISAIAIKGKAQEPAEASSGTIVEMNSNNAAVLHWMDIGQKQYSNSNVLWRKLPYEIYGAQWIQFAENQEVAGSFKVDDKSILYILSSFDSLKTPTWMANFTKIKGSAVNTNGDHYQVYVDTLAKGQEFLYGPTPSESVSLAVVPYYEMGDGENDRPSTLFEAEMANYNADKTDFFRKETYVDFGNKSDPFIEWEVSTGLAGNHLIRFKYMNVSTEPVKVDFNIIASNGNIIKSGQLTFPVMDQKWKILNTTTGGYINAGTYTIRISGNNLQGLWLESFEFQ